MQIWLQILLKSLFLYFLVLILIRIIGKRNISRETPFKFVNYVVIAIIAALISLNIVPNLAYGLIALGVWALALIAIENLSSKSKWVHEWVEGKETILVKHGRIMEENLSEVRLAPEDLLRELRSRDAFNLADVEFAIMESNGEINVLLKSDKKPVTAHDLGVKTAPQTEPQTVILDGNILNEPLSSLGLNEAWLKTQLVNTGVNVENVFVGQVDSSGDLYLDLYDDVVQIPQPKVKEMLYANLEKAQADLMGYALETKDNKAKQMYSSNADRLKQAVDKLKPYLLR